MIVKITKGKGWRGAHEYIANKPGSTSISSNLSCPTPNSAAVQIAKFRSLRPTLNKAVAHFSLSVPPNDRPLGESDWSKIAIEFLSEMGFNECPYVVYRHADTEHDHIHILALRINAKGETISDKNDFRRAEQIARKLEQRHQLKTIEQKEEDAHINTQGRNNMNKPTIENIEETTESKSHQIEINDDLTLKQRRNLKRLLLEESYEETIRLAIGSNIQRIKIFKDAKVIYIKPQGYLRDIGDSITSKDVDDELAAELMIDIACSRGWRSIKLTGNDIFLKTAMRLSIQKGIHVIARDSHQQTILDEILKSMTIRIDDAADLVLTTEAPESIQHGHCNLLEQTPEQLLNRLQEQRQKRESESAPKQKSNPQKFK